MRIPFQNRYSTLSGPLSYKLSPFLLLFSDACFFSANSINLFLFVISSNPSILPAHRSGRTLLLLPFLGAESDSRFFPFPSVPRTLSNSRNWILILVNSSSRLADTAIDPPSIVWGTPVWYKCFSREFWVGVAAGLAEGDALDGE